MHSSEEMIETLLCLRLEDLEFLALHEQQSDLVLARGANPGVVDIIKIIPEPGSARLLLYKQHRNNGGMVFAPIALAFYVASIRNANYTAKTWGQFMRMIPLTERRWLEQSLTEENLMPSQNEAFESEWLSDHYDNFYPQRLQTMMLSWIPADILFKYGKRRSLSLYGDHFFIPPENLIDIIAELEKVNFVLWEAQDLSFC